MQELPDLFQRNRKHLEKQVFLCCFISIFAKTVDVFCIFNNKYRPFSAILVILIKFSSHPRVIFANARSSLKFGVSYIARFIIVNIWSVSRLFPRVFLTYSQSGNPKKKLV